MKAELNCERMLFENAGSHPKNARRKTTKNITRVDAYWRQKRKGQTSHHLEKNNTTRPARHGDKLGRVQDYSCTQNQMESCCCPVFQPELEELN